MGGVSLEALEAREHLQGIPSHAAGMTGGCGFICKEKINKAKERCRFSLAHRVIKMFLGFVTFMGRWSVTAAVTFLQVKLLGNVTARSKHLGLKV